MANSDRRVSVFLQKAADLLCLNLPDQLTVGLDGEQIWFRYETWTVGLARYCFENEIDLLAANAILGPDFADRTWEEVALPMVKMLFHEELALQVDRHASAKVLGLVRGDGYSDLPVDRMLADRILLSMLDLSPASYRLVTDAVAREKDLTTRPIRVGGGFNRFYVTHGGVGLPVLSTWLPIGNALYSGQLFLPDILPGTIAAAARGRRVGDLVSTGVAGIDDRRIVSVEIADVESVDYPWPEEAGTRITIEPDPFHLLNRSRTTSPSLLGPRSSADAQEIPIYPPERPRGRRTSRRFSA